MDDLSYDNREGLDLPFGFRNKPVEGGRQEENWQGVEAAIRRLEDTPVPMIGEMRSIRWGRIFVAAASLMAVAFGIWYIGARTGRPEIAEIRTGYGEVKNILLPDSSLVTLNANSLLRMPKQWSDKDSRQVWLDGEAYFQVKKKPSTVQKFVVHTSQVDVEVLGTKFNVNTRRQHSIVSLEEGKVQLLMHGNVASVIEKKPMILRPGEVVVVDESRKATLNEDKDVVVRSGWTRNEFHFDHTTLADVARLIEDTYGYTMEVEDSSMLDKAISGDLRVSNLQDMVKVASFSFGYNMRIKNKTIYVTMQ
jgi:ferric-dicitrate binding protein FerR (iron transport regulator)